MNRIIRTATVDDIQDVLRMSRRNSHELGFIPLTAWQRTLENTNGCERLLVYDDPANLYQIPIGYIYFSTEGHIWQLCIDKLHRLQGYGRELVRQAVLDIKRDNPTVENITARVASKLAANGFWLAIGFSFTEQTHGQYLKKPNATLINHYNYFVP